jgi:hypothetical protein
MTPLIKKALRGFPENYNVNIMILAGKVLYIMMMIQSIPGAED